MIGRPALLVAMGGTVATALARKAYAEASEAPVAAIKYGNWTPCKVPERATMVFNSESKLVNAYRDDERKLLAEVTGRGPYD